MIQPAEVEKLLRVAFADAEIELSDLTGTHDHYQARVVSSAFAGKTLMEQHQLVHSALGAALNGPIHALTFRTYTPEQWAKIRGGT